MPIRSIAAAGLIALLPLPLLAQSVAGEPLRPENAKRAQAEAFRSPAASAAPVLRFQALPAERLAALQRHNAEQGKRLQIGLVRRVADEAATRPPEPLWLPVPGGRVARLDVVSPGAAALRVALDPRGLPPGAELRVSSPELPVVELIRTGEAQSQLDGSGLFWSPVTEGERQQIEVFVPGTAEPAGTVLRVAALSHLVASPFRSLSLAKNLGSSGSCNIDVACRTGTLGEAFVNAKNAVARMVFSTSDGTFTCTGTLLNDTVAATQVPYFYSAAHCISLQSEANTLTTFWNYETPTCGVASAGANTQLTGGADLLFAQLSSDALLLRLRSTPPAGAFFAGWDAATLSPSTQVIGIHHPSGDNKKYSRGNHSGFSSNVNIGGQTVTSAARSSWAEGTTEGGSSGSGLFTLTSGEYRLRGGLAGGSASCANSGQSEAAGNVDYYSRFDQVFPSIRQWLDPTVGPTRNYSGNWFLPSESGWGIQVFDFPGQLFVLFFVYDSAGRPAWYRMQGPWTGVDTITATLERPSGPPWAAPYNAGGIVFTPVGSATLTFLSESQATLSFNDGIVNRTLTLTKI